MRLSIMKDDPGYSVYAAAAVKDLLINGHPAGTSRICVMVDTETNELLRYANPDDAEYSRMADIFIKETVDSIELVWNEGWEAEVMREREPS